MNLYVCFIPTLFGLDFSVMIGTKFTDVKAPLEQRGGLGLEKKTDPCSDVLTFQPINVSTSLVCWYLCRVKAEPRIGWRQWRRNTNTGPDLGSDF